MLFVLACSTGCPSDDIPTVTSGDDTTTTDAATTTGITTLPTQNTTDVATTDVATGGMDTTTGGVDTEGEDTTEGADESSSGGDTCGDGVLDDGEDCDGDDLGGAACTDQGFVGGDLACNDDCTFDTSACTEAMCGDGIIEGDEDCEGMDLGGEDCLSQGMDGGMLGCTADCEFDLMGCFMISCGDDTIQPPEVCDGTDLGGADCVSEGFDGGMLGCDPMGMCMAFDTSGCFVCGDDTVGGPETCDGTDLNGQDCVSQGFDEGTLACNADCGGYDTSGCATCGDDAIGGTETCDGTDLGGQTCVGLGFGGGTLACNADCGTFDTSGCTMDVCGDGAVTGPEVCDGADVGGATCVGEGFDDGVIACNATCDGLDTSGCFSCGDGVVGGAEECDGADLAGADCASQGFGGGGTLACAADCTFDTAMCIPGGTSTTVCSTPGTPVGPDAGSVNTDTIVVPAGGDFITDVNVFVDANHTWVGDLEISVTQVENNVPALIMENPCGNQDDIFATFDQDLGAAPACAGVPAISGDILPDPGSLDVFTGIPDGDTTWQLDILDEVGGDGGTLNEWCVTIEYGPDPTACGDGVLTFGEQCEGADLQGNDCVSQGFPAGGTLACDAVTCGFDTSACDASAGVCGNGILENDGVTSFEDCDGNEGIAGNNCEGLGFAGGSLDCGFPACGFDTSGCSDTVIAACNNGLGLTIDGDLPPVENVINLADAGNVGDIDVFVDANHAWVGDLDITLVNDTTGTSVDLFFDQCTLQDDVWAFFNDEGNGPADCVEPFALEGNVTPDNPLSAFDGGAIAGDWRLVVADDAGPDDGVLNGWCVYITPE
ncbi:MAG: hypothetical protein AAF799_33745 [Myxococcota bacterium]